MRIEEREPKVTRRLIVRAEDVVVRALNQLAPLQDRLLGTVLTRVDLKRMSQYDCYYSSAYIEPYTYVGKDMRQPAA